MKRLRPFTVVGLTRRYVNSMAKTFNHPGMERWKGRVAVVTGASAGMGYELTKTLAQLGVVVVGCARNSKSIEVSVFRGRPQLYRCEYRSDLWFLFTYVLRNS